MVLDKEFNDFVEFLKNKGILTEEEAQSRIEEFNKLQENKNSIESRARQYAEGKDRASFRYAGYVKGATEQKQIDIDKVCDLMISMLNDGTISTSDIGYANILIRKELQ